MKAVAIHLLSSESVCHQQEHRAFSMHDKPTIHVEVTVNTPLSCISESCCPQADHKES